jgi:ABC-2 type transport system permease protein
MTPMFYIVGGLCTLVWSFLYVRVLEDFARKSLQVAYQSRGQVEGLSIHFEAFVRHISLVNFLMIMAVPALTMRLLAEEKKMRTYDLLLTSPVTATQIALGKFLAGFMISGLLVALSFVYPLTTGFLAEFQWGPLIASYVGLMLVVGTYVAVGVFASSLTESVMLAVVMALIFNVGLWFVGSFSDAFDDTTLTAVFEHLSLGQHFLSFVKGSIETTAVVFFGSIIALNCFLTQRVIESSRWR